MMRDIRIGFFRQLDIVTFNVKMGIPKQPRPTHFHRRDCMNIPKKIFYALVTGAIAITINILLLNLCDAVGIVTARGGLQRLVRLWLGGPLTQIGVAELWTGAGLPGPDTAFFRTGFKVSVGLAMAVFYPLVFEPLVAGGTLLKGLAYSLFAWVINAFVVLPLLGEGIAGAKLLTVGGMAAFAAAHTVFFIVLAYLYAGLSAGMRKRHATA